MYIFQRRSEQYIHVAKKHAPAGWANKRTRSTWSGYNTDYMYFSTIKPRVMLCSVHIPDRSIE